MTVLVLEDQPSSLLEQFQAAVTSDLKVLSLLHRQELDAATLQALQEAEFPQGLGLQVRSQRGLDALKMLQQAIVELRSDQAMLDELAADFANIYLLHGYRASPYESVWRDEEQLERQLPMFEISQVYRKHGLKAANRQTMPDDHLSLQLEFIAYLFEHAEAETDLLEAAQFMDAHILLWVDEFANRVSSRCMTMFYAGLTVLTAAYVNELRDSLVHITGRDRPSPEEQTLQAGKPQNKSQEMPVQYIPGAAPSW